MSNNLDLRGPHYTEEYLAGNENWKRTDYPDGSIKWEMINIPPIQEEIGEDPEDLKDLSPEELNALAVKAQVDVLRQHRKKILDDSDWTQQPDSPISDSKREEWRVYRQKLRDLTEGITTVEEAVDFIWPEPPE